MRAYGPRSKAEWVGPIAVGLYSLGWVYNDCVQIANRCRKLKLEQMKEIATEVHRMACAAGKSK